ncbi:2-octaprenyl-6-methoxyphenol hydroxylase [Acetobacter ghanensis]|uniref:2-octaprenyl-6-methoxyphenol hydroxylase n=1 Tax=Acetobacter ghanensis TaxID=431306 RepID=A0A0U5F5U5_9PROT|nr:2-octaprenyl-6-methoxyphenol hydroxylase [Acetobacter ghanensis]
MRSISPDAKPENAHTHTSHLADVDVCIIGAGPVGAALACRLARGGMRVAIVDKTALPPMENPDLDGRAYAIAAGPKEYLESAGVWDALPATPCPIEEILVTDGRPGEPASSLFLNSRGRMQRSLLAGWLRPAPCVWL